MTTLKKIWINELPSRSPGPTHELRLDWSNDRHQAIALERLDPDTIKQALLDAAILIGKEHHGGHL